MKELVRQLKAKEFKNCYIFYGKEVYLRKTYENLLKNSILPDGADAMNYDVFEGKKTDITKIFDAIQTFPFLSEKRLVVIKDSGLFVSGRKEDTDAMADFLKEIPSSTCILFSEDEIDKRNKLYKSLQKEGYIVEMNGLSEKDLIAWLKREFKKSGLQIEQAVAVSMLRMVGTDMENLSQEMRKVMAYKAGETLVTHEDIMKICSQSFESRIFDMVDAVGNQKHQEALAIYRQLLHMKESPIMILSMMIRQFRMIYQCKLLLDEGRTISDISQRTEIREFIVRECLKQGKNFSNALLEDALKECLDIDVAIKTGKLTPELAVELLILNYGNKKRI